MSVIESIIYKKNAKEINEIISRPIVDVTITSPPYFDLKDYGHKEQIGFGQEYSDYLDDLTLVFKNVFAATKDNGTLWVIIDTYRRDGEMIPLPFDFSARLKPVGWKLQEIIIWGKDRTVPWTHKGQMRNLFEYILVFSKGDKYNFYIDKVRDTQTLKKWWVKYPERYNPKGKTPDAIWHFDIPTQGSWGDGYIDHFCPLPDGLIEQILKITTKENDVVLDPFAGSGAVLSKADNMNRKYIGFELNEEYIKMFKNHLLKTGSSKRREYERSKNNNISQNEFQKLIKELRALKYAKVLYSKLKDEKDSVLKIYVEKSNIKPNEKNKIFNVNYYILLKKGTDVIIVKSLIEGSINKAPLSKFGIEPTFHFIKDSNRFNDILATNLYSYTATMTHSHVGKFVPNDLTRKTKELIISPIKLELVESDYE